MFILSTLLDFSLAYIKTIRGHFHLKVLTNFRRGRRRGVSGFDKIRLDMAQSSSSHSRGKYSGKIATLSKANNCTLLSSFARQFLRIASCISPF